VRKLLIALLAVLILAVAPAAQAPTSQPAAPLLLTHVNVVDVVAGTVQRDQDVVVRGDTIASVAPAGAAAPAGARTVDATGKFLVPGLADMHVHWYDERYLGLFIANGVTTVRQMWGFPLHFVWMGRIQNGGLLAPRMHVASAIVDGPNPVWPNSTVVADPADAAKVVAAIKTGGYDFVKVYSRLSKDAFLAIAKAARENEIPFAGHVPPTINAGEASDAGQKSIEHMTGILLAASSDEARLRERSIALFKGGEATQGMTVETRAAMRELSEALLSTYDAAKASALFAKFVKNSTWMSPTLVVLRSMSSLDDATFTSDLRVKYMPKTIRDGWNPASDPRNATKAAADYAIERRVYKKNIEVLGAMHKAGVRIIAGTDVLNPFAFPGFSLHDELGLLVDAGLSRADALRAATINPAIYMGTEKTAGTVETGKNADLVLLDANPLDDIANTKRISAVVARGRFLDRAALDAILANAEKISAPVTVKH
jgi:imidazolonepropionase-like amidohydrolase